MLLAVSGGRDSMVMAELCRRCGVPFAVAHCNFSLRGQESDSDEALVASWCASHGVKMHSVRFDTQAFASENGISVEMAARELRYGWFARLCREQGYCALAVAHNANDNAETLMLNLLRGTGLKGICGMRTNGPFPYPGCSDLVLLRPMLRFSREQITRFALENDVPFRDDSTNEGTDYKRNKLRHKVFPVFGEINPSFLQTLSRDMEYFCSAQEVLDGEYASLKASICTSEGDSVRIPLASFKALAPYMQYRMMEEYGFNADAMESLSAMLEAEGTFSGKVLRNPAYELFTAPEELIVRPVRERSGRQPVVVEGPGEYDCCGVRFCVEVLDREKDMPLKQPLGTVAVDADKLPFPFTVRGFAEGDWMVPLGMRGRKKLSDIFTDLHIPVPDKEKALVIASEGGRVLSLLGLRIDGSVKVTDKTERILRITI